MWINGGKGGRSIVDLVSGSRKRSSYAYGGGAFLWAPAVTNCRTDGPTKKARPPFSGLCII